jgi:uncharacterized protein (TIGR02246 family)
LAWRKQKREPMTRNEEKKIEQLIREVNRAWTEGRLGDLPGFFDERVIAIAPEGDRIEGREAMVESFRQFLAMARVDDFQVTGIGVDVFDHTAVARFGFAVRYELDGACYDETGSEVLVLVESEEGWRIVWRTQLPATLSS